jgi:hypothetical protein
MKNTLTAALTALSSLVCLTVAPHVEARGVRADIPGAPGCQLSNWTNPQSPGQSPFIPGGVTLGSSGSDTVVTCSSNGDNSIINTVDATHTTQTTDINSFFVTNGNIGGPEYPMSPNEAYVATGTTGYLATSGQLYQFVSSGSPGHATAGTMDAQVVVWTLGNSDTEIELNNWCTTGTAGASVVWGTNTYTGGCSSSTNDLLFNKAGGLVGYVNDINTLKFISATSLPADWSTKSGTVSAPEIDPASAIGALALLAGSLAVLRGGRRTLDVSQ